MTRISAGVKPSELCDKMLLAEHREIIRIPNTIKSGKAKINLDKIPGKFKLGQGHVIFFYDKLKYLHNRYLNLHNECIKRGFNVQDFNGSFKNAPQYLYNDWSEDLNARKIVSERINTRLQTMQSIRYNSKGVDYNFMKL